MRSLFSSAPQSTLTADDNIPYVSDHYEFFALFDVIQISLQTGFGTV